LLIVRKMTPSLSFRTDRFKQWAALTQINRFRRVPVEHMVSIDSVCDLDRFRRFMIMSTCQSYIPMELDQDETVYPERSADAGTMYVEAEDKETVGQIRELRFTRVSNVLGIIYNSKSGRTQLKWRHLQGRVGRLSGQASPNTLVNLFASQALPESYALAGREQEQRPAQHQGNLNEAFADT